MIKKTYYDGNPEDRDTIGDFWSWLKDQPQDAWLLWARCANWDNADTIFEFMIKDPRCDLAVVSQLFWASSPAFYVKNPKNYSANTIIGRITTNAERGFYTQSNLYYNRYEDVIAAHDYINALKSADPAAVPFRLPRVLCGPFNGRMALLPKKYDAETERDLLEIFDHIDGWLPRSEQDYWDHQEKGGNLWIKNLMQLPDVPENALSGLRHLDDVGYLEAVFGLSSDYKAARAKTVKAQLGAVRSGETLLDKISDPDGWTVFKWLTVFFAAAMTLAIVMRRINFGVWF
jgi:Domain of unknown function (DUF4274)